MKLIKNSWKEIIMNMTTAANWSSLTIMTCIRFLLQRCQTRDKDGKLQTTTDKLNHYILTKRKKEILHTVFYRELA